MKTARNPHYSAWYILLASIALSFCIPATSYAAWTGAANDKVYGNTANWADDIIDDTFSGTLDLTANIEITVGAAGGTWDFSGLFFSYTDNYKLTLLRPSGTTATWNLNSDISVDIAGDTTSQTVQIGVASRPSTFDLGGATRTFSINEGKAWNASGRDTLTIVSDLTNGSILKTGSGTLLLNSANTLTGRFEQTGGSTFLQRGSDTVNGALTQVSHLSIANSMTRFVLNSSAADRLNDTATIALNGGIFGFQTRSDDPAGITVENVGAITLSGARSAIGVVSVAGQDDTILQAASLDRDAYATLSLLSTNANVIGNSNAFFKVTNDQNILDSLRGGSGSAGSTTLKIVPWATAGRANSDTLIGSYDSQYYVASQGLVTYTSDGGFRALTDSEYQTDLTAAAADENVRITASTTLGSDRTVNALHVASTAASTLDLGGHTLTLAGGALAASNSALTLSNGTLDLGAGVGYIQLGRSGDTISANAHVRADSGLVLASAYRVLLYGTLDTGTGPLVINSGALYTKGDNRLAAGTAVRVDRSASFVMDGGYTETIASLSGSGTVNLNNNAAKLNIGSSFIQTAANREVVIGNGGTLNPGDTTGDYRADTITLTGVTSLRFETGSILNIDITSADTFDSIELSTSGATVTFDGGTLNLSLIDGYVLKDGDTFQLFTVAGQSVAGSVLSTENLTIIGDSAFIYTLDNSGLLTISTAIPEPAAIGLIAGGLILILALGKRRLHA